ncbi:uncharacterized protein MELLADRAFT_94601 [Melampsora larici-populina 98AG31]|uniref:Uncharacterized protein n=1 Tax=Melampsora larici-populina (strain 98AG31 / pathotype 3-4-7) TaxID=747676 RepID=F4RC24_MELLP|nr:uncharacterized protein MELLADRAFT_94601 [Melampsora larici-populina 98AG31]EGG10237.1 hypothetical protein MELLADRAFT_94601 [Melampsora larici-populina 98AG31]
MDKAMQQAAQRAAHLTLTRSRLVALGQLPGPPLEPPRRNRATGDDDVDGEPIQDNKLEGLIDDAAGILQGPLIGSDAAAKTSWAPPVQKGKGKAVDNTSPTPSWAKSPEITPYPGKRQQ